MVRTRYIQDLLVNRVALLALGLLLVAAGGVGIVRHALLAGGLPGAICGSGAGLDAAWGLLASTAHCPGCPLALVGVLLLLLYLLAGHEDDGAPADMRPRTAS